MNINSLDAVSDFSENELNFLKGQRVHSLCVNFEDCESGKHLREAGWGEPNNGSPVCKNFRNKMLFVTLFRGA